MHCRIALILLLAYSTCASAAYTQLNSNIQDHGVYTRDLASGLDWLDVTQTRGMSYLDVKTELETGSALGGWRYATHAELVSLLLDFSYTPIHYESAEQYPTDEGILLTIQDGEVNDVDLLRLIIRTLGDTFDASYDEHNSTRDIASGGAGGIMGMLGTFDRDPYLAAEVGGVDIPIFSYLSTEGIDSVFRDSGEAYPCEYCHDGVFSLYGSTGPESGGFNTGSFLVRVSEVPVPAAFWLFCSAIIGLAGIKRKK